MGNWIVSTTHFPSIIKLIVDCRLYSTMVVYPGSSSLLLLYRVHVLYMCTVVHVVVVV